MRQSGDWNLTCIRTAANNWMLKRLKFLTFLFSHTGLYCESYANVHGAAVETQHMGSTMYGLCEHKVNATSY